MKLLVTGGTGFLGRHLLRQAVEEGHECIALARPGSLTPEINCVSWLRSELDQVPAAEWEGVEALVHLASAGVSPQHVTWAQAMEVNVFQSLAMMAAAVAAGVSQLLLCGSCFEYGRSGERYEFIPSDAPLEPVGPYATSKAAFSVAAAGFARTTRSSLVLLRPFHFFGEGQHESNFWPSLREAALGGRDFPMTPGEQIRDFQPVEETAEAFMKVLRRWPGESGQMTVKNVGSGHPVTLLDFAQQWWSRWNADGRLIPGALPYRPGEVRRFVPKLENLTL
ncbi:NAD-dependent epimerase/dehydratase family protein [Haloferula sargassicola]|uniref:GDP-6-deoxy-D-mannose reductase n=1 Tax=Haloferula sargassicola TaxID=490096 RepID=A0ABP9UTG6_9BACT